jgi:hypothetical protein
MRVENAHESLEHLERGFVMPVLPRFVAARTHTPHGASAGAMTQIYLSERNVSSRPTFQGVPASINIC